jgi:signal transduction histidine kinase
MQKASMTYKELDTHETICDVNSSCKTALDILNDLLCFDELESGILEVNKHEVPVLPFIFDCVSMFSSQAKACGVNILMKTEIDSDTHTDNTCLGIHSILLELDTILMNKFKMDQVLRNLISNALKFTPRGGTVTVKATLVQNIDSVDDSAAIDNSSIKPKTCIDVIFSASSPTKVYVTEVCQDLEAGANRRKIVFGKLVIIVTDTGAGMSDINQNCLFKEVVQFHLEILQAGGGSGLGL